MIPFKDDNPTKKIPIITISIIIINALVFFYEIYIGEDLHSFILQYGVIPSELYQFKNFQYSKNIHPILSTFTSIFIHGGFFHIIGNMLYLYVFGDNIENKLGHVKYLIFYLAAGFFASSAHFLINYESQIPVIGASGAVSGVMGAYFIAYPKAKVHTLIFLGIFIKIIKIPAYIVLGFFIIIQIINGLLMGGANISNVAWFAHIGGFVFGVLIMIIFGLAKKR